MTETGALWSPPWRGSAGRIGALVLRHTYLLRRSWPRLLELMYWPTVQMIIWGLVTMFLVTNSSWVAQAAGVLLAGVILWDVMFRGQIGLSLVFIEEMWSRNLGHLFVSPLRPWELIFALMLISLIRTLIGMAGAVGFAYLLYAFSIFDLGFALIGFFVNLIVMGWAVGFFVAGLVLRYGLGAESLAWFLISRWRPSAASTTRSRSCRTGWSRWPAPCPLPTSSRGMRELLVDGTFSGDHMMRASLLNIGWIAAGIATFLAFLRSARIRGLLHQIGE